MAYTENLDVKHGPEELRCVTKCKRIGRCFQCGLLLSPVRPPLPSTPDFILLPSPVLFILKFVMFQAEKNTTDFEGSEKKNIAEVLPQCGECSEKAGLGTADSIMTPLSRIQAAGSGTLSAPRRLILSILHSSTSA